MDLALKNFDLGSSHVVVVYKKPNVYSSTGQQMLCWLDLLKWFVCKRRPTASFNKRFKKSLLTKAFADLSRRKHLQFFSFHCKHHPLTFMPQRDFASTAVSKLVIFMSWCLLNSISNLQMANTKYITSMKPRTQLNLVMSLLKRWTEIFLHQSLEQKATHFLWYPTII